MMITPFIKKILRLVGDKIGKTIRTDGTTLFGNCGNYACICVKVDLRKPLLSKYRLHRRVRRIEYEGCMKSISCAGGMAIRMSHAQQIVFKMKIRRLSRKRHLTIQSSAKMKLDRRWMRSSVPR
ncbi:hypothetical protein LINPERHAP2_LOCUS11853 [Linum perenne]